MIRNPIAWCAWTIAALGAAFIDRNPFLQALLLLVLINVWLPYRRGRPMHLRLGLALAIVPLVFSVALSRFGTHVLFTLPAVPVLGGRWTWEALLFGASSGAALLLTVAVFVVVQATVRSADLVSLLPRPLYRAGTALALSVAFAPKTIQTFQGIEEARRLRGQRTGWRSAPAILVPLLLTTLERALQYGESLDARGYGNRRRSRYRPIPWSAIDLIALISSIIALLLVVMSAGPAYDPYSRLDPGAPPISAIIALLLLALPAIMAAVAREAHTVDRA